MGSTYSEVWGFILSGGGYDSPSSAEVQSTFDGATFDTTTIPDLPEGNSYHCMATGPDNTIYSLGGRASNDVTTHKLEVY